MPVHLKVTPRLALNLQVPTYTPGWREALWELRTFTRKFSTRKIFFKDNELLVPEMQKKLGVTVFVSDIKRVENQADWNKLAHIIQHGVQGFMVKNLEGDSTETNDLSLILKKWNCCVINFEFYQRFHNVFQKVFETVASMNEELKRTEFNCTFCKKLKLLVNRFSSFFAKGRKLVEKMIHQKKNGGHPTSKIIKSRKAIVMAICPIICSFYCSARALMHDVVCKFACTEGYAETISAKVLKWLAQEHNTMFPARARTQTARSRDKWTNHEATAPP